MHELSPLYLIIGVLFAIGYVSLIRTAVPIWLRLLAFASAALFWPMHIGMSIAALQIGADSNFPE